MSSGNPADDYLSVCRFCRGYIDAEQSAARKYDCRVVGERKTYVDLVSEENGTYYQCKSAVYRDESGYPGVLRFNLHHLRSLRRESHQCGVVVVLYSSVGSDGSNLLKITRVLVSEVLEVVDGRWYPETDEYEVPWPILIQY
ncbi:hypothetical protein [Halorussus pelagicus]|uniref:hypothetical protein n=1 Tax=Halorussus pelagicus TaxID=2505977 RepID=UPI000FFB9AE1|nr:hypothetical protein [Halorussus pelagicus]